VLPSALMITGPISSNLMLSPSFILGMDGSFDASGSNKTSSLSSLPSSSIVGLLCLLSFESVDMADTVRKLLLTNALLSLETITTVRNNTNDDGSINKYRKIVER